MDFKYDPASEFNIFLEHGAWATPEFRKFGLILGADGQLYADMWQGETPLGGDSWSGISKPKPDTWYRLLLLAGQDARLTGFIWEIEDPSNIAVYEREMGPDWAGLTWRLSTGANRGSSYHQVCDPGGLRRPPVTRTAGRNGTNGQRGPNRCIIGGECPHSLTRLKALGVKTGAADLPTPERLAQFGIDSVMSGTILPTEMGETFVYEERFAADYRARTCTHPPGRAADDRLAPGRPTTGCASCPSRLSPSWIRRPPGLAGGTGTYAFLVGAARFTAEGDFVLQQFFMRDPSEEPALLDALGRFLAPAQALVTFNGKAFDAPLLNTRYLMHRMPNPMRRLRTPGPAAAGAAAVARPARIARR